MITVFLSNKTLQVVSGSAGSGRISVKYAGHTLNMDRLVINGTVMDNDRFVSVLSDFWKSERLPRKDVHLVVDSSQFITRLVSCPELNQKKTMDFIKLEFATVERAADPVFGYFFLSTDKKAKVKRLFASMVERSFIENYISLFAKAGISVKSIEPALACSLRLLKRSPQLKNGTSLIQIADDMSITSILLVDGVYTYSNKKRFIAERDTAEFSSEVGLSVSSMVQFEKARQSEKDIDRILFAGLSDSEVLGCAKAVFAVAPTIPCGKLELGAAVRYPRGDSTEYVYPIGGLIPASGPSLVAQKRVSPEKAAKKKKTRKVVLPLAAVLLVLLLVSGGMFYIRTRHQRQLNEYLDYINGEKIQEKRQEYIEKQAQLSLLLKKSESMEAAVGDIASYPISNSSVDKILKRCSEGVAEVGILSFDRDSGVLRVSATTPDVESINVFIELLRNETIFQSVSYTGYAYNDTMDVWVINVVCYLSETAGKTEVSK